MLARLPAQNTPNGARYAWTEHGLTAGRVYSYQLSAVVLTGGREDLATASAIALSQPVVISDYALLPNFPNPFNGQTTIQFDVPVAADVAVTVYDVTGRRVADLFHGAVEAGRHTLRFDADGLPSGVYLCHMQTGDFSTLRKLLLLK